MSKRLPRTRNFVSRNRRKMLFAAVFSLALIPTAAAISKWKQEKELTERETRTDEVYPATA